MPVLVMEWSGGLRGAGMGMPVGDHVDRGSRSSMQDGVDLESVRAVSDGVGVLGYVREVEALRRDLQAYRAALASETQLSVAVRPMPPDCESPAELADKIAFLGDFGADWVEFYHTVHAPPQPGLDRGSAQRPGAEEIRSHENL